MEQRFKPLVDLFGILFLFLLDGVLVDGFEHVVRGVTDTLLCVFVGDTSGQHNGCVHVAEVMETEVRDTGLLTDPLKAVIHSMAG